MNALGSALLLGGYGLLWSAARPLLRRHKRLREDFSLRLAPEAWAPEGPVDIWIQAASGGEAFLAVQLLDALQCVHPQAEPQRSLRILCTSCTRQGLDVLRDAARNARPTWPDLAVTVRVFPLDRPDIMRRARAQAAPKVLVLLETELWPGLMAACEESHTPVLVVNGRMTEKSLAGYRLIRFFWERTAPRKILAMAEADAARFAALFGAARVAVMPNMKFDGVPQTPFPVPPDSPANTLLPPGLPVVLLASVREEEEALLAPVIRHVREHAPGAAVVVAPRHMERVAAWRSLPAPPVALRSVLEREGGTAAPGEVVIWDVFGELASLYARANAVFVGGSLAPLGGQNFLESAAQGKIPVIGPHWRNFAWVGEAFFDAGLGMRVADAAALGPALVNLVRDAPDPESIREKTAAYVAPRRGGSSMAARAAWEMLAGENACNAALR